MKPIVKLLLEGGGLNSAQMAQVLKLSEAEVNRQLDELNGLGRTQGQARRHADAARAIRRHRRTDLRL